MLAALFGKRHALHHGAGTLLGSAQAAMADLPLVNIRADVIHRLHGGASLVFLNQRPLSSAFLHQALLLRPIHSNLSGLEIICPSERVIRLHERSVASAAPTQ